MTNRDVLRTGDVAKLCRVAARTVTKWIDNGSLKGFRIPGSAHRRVTRDDFIAFAKAHGMEFALKGLAE